MEVPAIENVIKNRAPEREENENRDPNTDTIADTQQNDALVSDFLVASAASNGSNRSQFYPDRVRTGAKPVVLQRTFEPDERLPFIDLTNFDEEPRFEAVRIPYESRVNTFPIASTSAAARAREREENNSRFSLASGLLVAPATSNDFNDRSQFDAKLVKLEMKTEVFERLLDANQREPIVDLIDFEEEAAFDANGNNCIDDSDDEIQVALDQLQDFVPALVKFDVDGNDVFSGDMPYVINVSSALLSFIIVNRATF